MENNNFEGEQEPQPFTPETPEENQTDQPAAKPKLNKKLLIGTAVVVVALLAGVGYLGMQIYDRNQTGEEVANTGEVAGVAATDPAAIVNGVEISRARFDFRYNLEAKNAPSSGLDLTNTDTQKLLANQILDNLVTVELLLQQAEAAGISTTDEEVNVQYQIIVDTLGGEALFNEQLAKDNVSAADIYNDIREQLIIENFVNYYSELVGIEVTDEEISKAYDDASLINEGLPSLETVADEIKDQMMKQRGVEAVNQLLESVKAASDIQLLL